MELKNKSTTMNKNSKKGLLKRLKQFEKENPSYKSVIGQVHDSKNRFSEEDEDEIKVYYYGENSLFKAFFGEYSDEVKNFITDVIKSFYEKKSYKSN